MVQVTIPIFLLSSGPINDFITQTLNGIKYLYDQDADRYLIHIEFGAKVNRFEILFAYCSFVELCKETFFCQQKHRHVEYDSHEMYIC